MWKSNNKENIQEWDHNKNKWALISLSELQWEKIKDAIKYPKEYIEVMHQNYPTKTEKEIIEGVKRQKDYEIRFHHLHEWISEELIKKYLLLDEYDSSDVVKITLETDENHDCNLVKLTPELQEKAYWWHRWDRSVVSHLINRNDYPGEFKTNKLTVIGKRDVDTFYDEPYFFVVTAFWGDWESWREPRDNEYILKDMKYRMNYALIPEEWEEIEKTSKPMWANIYDYLTNSIWYCDNVEYMCKCWNIIYLKITKEWKYWILTIHWDEIRWLDIEQNLSYDKIEYIDEQYWYLYSIVWKNWKYEIFRFSSDWEKISYNIDGNPLYISSDGDVIFETWGQIFTKKFSFWEEEKESLPWELYSEGSYIVRPFYKNWRWKKVYMEEFLRRWNVIKWKKI